MNRIGMISCIFAFGLLAIGCDRCCPERIFNEGRTLAYSTEISDNDIVMVEVWDGSTEKLLRKVDTGASCYQKFNLSWISPDCILLKSSDIGNVKIYIENGRISLEKETHILSDGEL